jgi:hypothetical protein
MWVGSFDHHGQDLADRASLGTDDGLPYGSAVRIAEDAPRAVPSLSYRGTKQKDRQDGNEDQRADESDDLP